MSRLVLAASIVIALVVVHRDGQAHERGVSYSAWRIEGRRAAVTLRVRAIDAARAGGVRFGERLRLWAAGALCAPVDGSLRRRDLGDGWTVASWRMRCPSEPREIESRLFTETDPGHLHFVLVEGQAPSQSVLTAAKPRFDFGSGHGEGPTTFAGYLGLGVEHILSGYDHLVFLFALLLVARRLSAVALVVTGFTAGHSAALALAVLGAVSLDTRLVEALIGFSIFVVAAENVWLRRDRSEASVPLGVVLAAAGATAILALITGEVPVTMVGVTVFVASYYALAARLERAERLRWAIALLFGLVHGFGFAGVLAEAALPAERALTALFGFNLGVEAGQLALVAVAWPVLAGLVHKSPRADRLVVGYGSALAAGLGAFWFVDRAFGA